MTASESRPADEPGRTAGRDTPMLAVEGLDVSYGRVAALRGVGFAIEEGEFLGVIGPNGAGKSTLVDAITGFVDYAGDIRYRGTSVAGRSPSDLVARGLVHCTESGDLFGHMSVEDNLELGAYRRGGDIDARLSRVYDLFPRLAERRGQHAYTMSGGEQQMLAIGRALMSDPELLVLDEPTLGLAPVIVEDISDSLDDLREEGLTVLLCEQNVTFAMDHCERVILLENGEIVREGDPDSFREDDYIKDAYLGY